MDWFFWLILNLTVPGIIYVFCKGKYFGKLKKVFYPTIKKIYAGICLEELSEERINELKSIPECEHENPKDLLAPNETDSHTIYGIDNKNNVIAIKIVLKHSLHAEVMIDLKLNNGRVYRIPDDDGVLVCSIQSRQWKTNGLQIQVLEAYKRLRITFNGILKNISSAKSDKGQLEHVQFNFIWNAGSTPFHYPQSFCKDGFVNSILKTNGKQNDFLQYMSSERGYEQFGCLTGFLKGSEYTDELTFRLPSFRRRRWGFNEAEILKKEVSMFAICDNGTLFSFSNRILKSNDLSVPSNHGFVLLSNNLSHSIKRFSFDLGKMDVNTTKPTNIHFTIDKDTKLDWKFSWDEKAIMQSCLDREIGWTLTHITSKGTFAESNVNFIASIFEQHSGKSAKLPEPLLLPKTISNSEDILLCRLDSTECLDLSLTGGKANSLGLLLNIKSEMFTVPYGFVITTNGLKHHLSIKTHLMEAIKDLDEQANNKAANLEEICNSLMEKISNEPICDDLAKKVMQEVDTINSELNDEGKDWTWAVRSSGIGEDSDELSAAGQNSTFLGCKGNDILKAVVECWASLYSFHSVQYRRQHGIPVANEMAVVVQKTVPAECAGVLFTCNPSTGSPSEMIITSNYGLGESVVSAAADPDTITLTRKYDGEIIVSKCEIGTKKMEITLEERNDASRTRETTIDDERAKKLSVSEDQACRLGKVGVLLEEKFGNARDVEWAYYKNKLYLLQSRPITTLNNWTDFELLHEFDSPIFSENEVFTRVNIGEVMKGAITPLTYSTFLTQMDKHIQSDIMESPNPYVLLACPTFRHYGFLNVLNMLYKMAPPEVNSVEVRGMELAMLGHPFMDEKIHKEVVRRHGYTTGLKKLKSRMQLIWKAFFRKERLNTAKELNELLYNDHMLTEADKTPIQIFNKLSNSFGFFRKMLGCYVNVNFTNTFYNMVCISVLTGGESEFTPEHYHDIALVLKTSEGVETVELPILLQEIAEFIRKTGKSNEFFNLRPEDCQNWLKENCQEGYNAFNKFLDTHGHRLFSEYELNSKTWKENPFPILEMIQATCRSEVTTKMTKGMDVEETINKLQTKKSPRAQKVLKFLIRKLRHSLIVKEQTKSQFIRCLGFFRNAFRKLAIALEEEGYLPDRDLMYHLTFEEIKHIIYHRDPAIVSKAIRRKRLFSQWNRLQFSDLYTGFPVPERDGTEDLQFERNTDTILKIKGTPVCTGKVVGRACVVVELKECIQIQPGDILITYSTDVGWTPYFPMLSGVVTEIGGLLSHGAVVAREYGLPCIVGAQGAAKAFKTGDKVLLDGKTGELELISETQH